MQENTRSSVFARKLSFEELRERDGARLQHRERQIAARRARIAGAPITRQFKLPPSRG